MAESKVFIRDKEYGATTAGTATAYTLAILGFGALEDLKSFNVKFHVTNGVSATLDINGIGAKPLVDQNNTALPTSLLDTDGIYIFAYNVTIDKFVFMNAVTSPISTGDNFLFGDGSDGDLIVNAGTTNLNFGQVYNYNSIQIGVGGTLSTAGANGTMQIKCKNVCNIDGTIDLSGKGNNGALSYLFTNVSATPGAIGTGGNGGTTTRASGTVSGGVGSALGYGGGGAGGNADASATAPGAGGNGGTPVGVGGAGGFAFGTPTAASNGSAGGLSAGGGGAAISNSSGTTAIGGNGGGGAYGANGTDGTGDAGSFTPAGGGGGAGGDKGLHGGNLVLFARLFTGSGTITANGTNGGNAGNGGAGFWGAGGQAGGGGGGGGGGAAILVSDQIFAGTFTANGGAGGTGANNGANGSNGTAQNVLVRSYVY